MAVFKQIRKRANLQVLGLRIRGISYMKIFITDIHSGFSYMHGLPKSTKDTPAGTVIDRAREKLSG